jgi:N-acetylgalactosamine kinase
MAIRADTVVAIRVVPTAATTTTAGGASPEPPCAESATATAPEAPTLRLANLDSAAYPPAVFSADPDQPVDVANHSWGNYFLAAYKGVHDFLRGRAVGGGAPSAGGAPPPAPSHLPTPLPSLEVLVHGTVPLGSGLSSSAALVCSASLAILAAYGKIPPPQRGPFAWAAAAAAAAGLASRPITKGEVADFSCKAERYVGVNGGGMDQAISVMARQGVAMLVDFDPVRASEVPLPEKALFVVGHSLAVSKKAETADKRYNLRVVECRLAAALLARRLGASAEEAAAVRTLRDVEERVSEHGQGLLAAEEREAAEKARREAEKKNKGGKKNNKAEEVVEAVVEAVVDADSSSLTDPVARHSAAIATGISQERAMHLERAVKALLGGKRDPAAFKRDALEKELGIKLDDPRLFGDSAPSMRAIAAAGKDGFRLRDRALHVYGEAARVREFASVARAATAAADAAAAPSPSSPLTQESALARLGSLMDASHTSCASLYDCSAPELDEFCSAARQCRALGARLTGAGWGGCAVALVREAEAPAFLEAMRKRFYDKRISKGLVKKEELGTYLFATRPSSGAAVLRLDLFSSTAGSPSGGGAAASAGGAVASGGGAGAGLAGSLRGLSLRRSGAGTGGGGAGAAVAEAP